MKEEVEGFILAMLAKTSDGGTTQFGPHDRLFGESGALDSLQVVSLCIELEDRAEAEGFEFDWTSETVMSRSRSFLRSASTLADEYCAQRDMACRSS